MRTNNASSLLLPIHSNVHLQQHLVATALNEIVITNMKENRFPAAKHKISKTHIR
jgi:hypothetical protein